MDGLQSANANGKQTVKHRSAGRWHHRADQSYIYKLQLTMHPLYIYMLHIVVINTKQNAVWVWQMDGLMKQSLTSWLGSIGYFCDLKVHPFTAGCLEPTLWGCYRCKYNGHYHRSSFIYICIYVYIIIWYKQNRLVSTTSTRQIPWKRKGRTFICFFLPFSTYLLSDCRTPRDACQLMGGSSRHHVLQAAIFMSLIGISETQRSLFQFYFN